MRGRNLRPSRVHQTVTRLLESTSITQAPCWYKTIGAIPPSQILVRTQPIEHTPRTRKFESRKPSKRFQPLQIVYEEDALRKDFFSDHPWELARPRVMLESDGKDGNSCDWSNIEQPGRQLSGESVVQRQLWLMHNMGLSRSQAYDKARKEFYDLRHEQELEQRIQREEATWTGAYFGKGALEVGMELEDKSWAHWKTWASKEISRMELLRQSAYTSAGEDEPSPLVEGSEDSLDPDLEAADSPSLKTEGL